MSEDPPLCSGESQQTIVALSGCHRVFARSVGEIAACAGFDISILENTEHLSAGEIELNDLTLETIQHK